MTAERQTQSVRAMKATFCAAWIVIYAIWIIMEAHTVMTTTTHLAISGPFVHAVAEAAQQGQLDAERLRDHASRGCPGQAAATAWHWALLQLIDRDQGLRPCRCALAGRASVEGGDPICVRN